MVNIYASRCGPRCLCKNAIKRPSADSHGPQHKKQFSPRNARGTIAAVQRIAGYHLAGFVKDDERFRM
jgi:hypothetical protein